VKVKPERGTESYVWAVLDTNTDKWKEEPKDAKWSLFSKEWEFAPPLNQR
jgi:hypothetical protein